MTKVLVAAGSKHGSTYEMAEHVGATLTAQGLEVTVARADEVGSVADFDAVVLGSSVYAGHWHKAAKELAEVISKTPPSHGVWLFSSGPLGDPPKPDEDPADAATMVAITGARDHRVFSGKVDKAVLGLGERAIVAAVGAPEGDFRDWNEIGRWAEQIAGELADETAAAR